MTIPSLQQAAVKTGEGPSARCEVQTIDVHMPGPRQILCKINYSGLCGADKSLLYDEWVPMGLMPKRDYHGILGHEGVGTVAAVADDVKGLWKEGDRIGIKWVSSICRTCEFCTNGLDELQCPEQLNSGFSTPGTLQQYCLTDAHYATRIPNNVRDEEAGPILCGGVTAYTACQRSQVRPGQWVVIIGAGGGIGHFAVQYAKAMGMRSIAIDRGPAKGSLCMSLGAEHYIDLASTEDAPAEVLRITMGGGQGVIVAGVCKYGYPMAPALLRPGGTVVVVGLPSDPALQAGASPMLIALKRLNIVGTVTGTLRDVDEALDFVARGLVHPVLIHGTLYDINDLFAKMNAGELAGRAVIKIAA